MTVEELKHALINYHNIHKWWQVNSNRIEAIINEMEGVKGIRYDKPMSKGASKNLDQKQLQLIERKDKLIITNKHYEIQVMAVHDFIEWLEEPYKQIIIDKYFNDMNDTKLEHKHGYERSSVWHIVNRMINRYCNDST